MTGLLPTVTIQAGVGYHAGNGSGGSGCHQRRTACPLISFVGGFVVLYPNNGDGTFTDGTTKSVVKDRVGGLALRWGIRTGRFPRSLVPHYVAYRSQRSVPSSARQDCRITDRVTRRPLAVSKRRPRRCITTTATARLRGRAQAGVAARKHYFGLGAVWTEF